MDEALLTWIAAIENGFARDGVWIAWADDRIMQLDEPPQWLLHVCVEHTAKEALGVLYPACGTIAQQVWARVDWTGLQLGFLYLAYERDGTDLLGLLMKAGDLTDRANFRVGCEAFYLLANEIAGQGRGMASPRLLADRATALFRPFSDWARQRWTSLHREFRPGNAERKDAEQNAAADRPRE